MNTKFLGQVNNHAEISRLSHGELEVLAGEVREHVMHSVSRTGGHLASNLGITELTIALHHVFDFSRDRLVFDVGHQCYVHKMLTGRSHLFEKLRQSGGLSGFPSPAESEFDPFAVGHAGTAVATAVGLALGLQLKQSDERIVAVVGDASIVNGVAFEGLNNTSRVKRQLLIILNDNSMGISKTEGAFAQYLTRLRVSRSYEDLRRRTELMVRRLPYVGQKIQESLDRIKGGIKSTVKGAYYGFEQLGLSYFGPVDGHDTPVLIKLLNAFKEVDHPVLLHVYTEKGRGFHSAKEDPCRFHSPGPFKINGKKAEMSGGGDKTFTSVYADAMTELMERDERVVALTAAMADGTGVAKLQERFGERVIDVGIAESACVDIAAGLAKQGLRPVVTIYSTFLQRAYDQIFQEVSIQNLPVTFCVDRAGLVGGDGAVHHGFSDITFLRSLVNFVLMGPLDEAELHESLRFAMTLDQPAVIRYPRDKVPQGIRDSSEDIQPFELGKAVWLRQGKEGVIVFYGAIGQECLLAAQQLHTEGIEVGVVNARFAKPLDETLLCGLLSKRERSVVVTVEDHGLAGGFGSAVLEMAQRHGLDTRPVRCLGLPDAFISHKSRKEQLIEVGIDSTGIAKTIRELLRGAVGQEQTETGKQTPLADQGERRKLKSEFALGKSS